MEIKRPTRCNRLVSLLQNLLFVQHVLDTIMPIIRSSGVIQMAATICITLELLMMVIMVPETCWTNNEFCNKEANLLHLVGLSNLHVLTTMGGQNHIKIRAVWWMLVKPHHASWQFVFGFLISWCKSESFINLRSVGQSWCWHDQIIVCVLNCTVCLFWDAYSD